jgi:flagellar basal body rod protein FlgC
MTSYLYKPEHPLANESGFVTKDTYYEYLYLTNVKDKQMMNGNQPVTLRFISDNLGDINGVRHMVNGKYYTSKKKFRDETKARGCIEVGNETTIKPRKQILPDKRKRREDIKRAIWELKNGRDIVTEVKNVPKE